MKYFLILLLVVIFVSSMFPRYETFEINDYYSRYLNDISVPSEFYFQGKVAQGLKTFELKDKFFIDALESNLNKDVMSNQVEDTEKVNIPSDALDGINKYLEKILNARLPSEDTSLFATVFGEITSAKSYKTNSTLYTSRHIVHRDGKVYGASIEMSTFVTRDNIYLVGYKLIGFVFNDKLDNQQPYNLDQNENQYFMQDKNVTKDDKYIKQYLCQYYSDVEKYRGIKIPTDIDCTT